MRNLYHEDMACLSTWVAGYLLAAFMCVLTESQECLSVGGQNNSIMISPSKLLRGTVEYIQYIPFSQNTEQTAPMPQNISADWYVTDGNWIGLTVQWSQRADDLATGSIKGYFLEFVIEEAFVATKLNISSEDVPGNGKSFVFRDVINFVYQCFGITNTLLNPGDQIRIRLHSLPMFRRNDKSQFMEVKVVIPECREDQRLTRVNDDFECIAFWEGYLSAIKTATSNYRTDKTTLFVHQLHPDHTIYFILAGAITIFIIIPILLLMACRSGRGRRGHPAITMITNESLFDMTTAHKLVTKLREHYDLNITTNWENQEIIGRDGYQWYHETINRSTIAVFLFESWPKTESSLNDVPMEIRQAMKYAECIQVTTKITTVIVTTQLRRNTKSNNLSVIIEANRDFYKLLRILTGTNVPKTLTLEEILKKKRRRKRGKPIEPAKDITSDVTEDGKWRQNLLITEYS